MSQERILLAPIIKITMGEGDFYLEWNILHDCPHTYGMPLKVFESYYKQEYGDSGMLGLQNRLKVVEETGCSFKLRSETEETEENMHDYLLSINRAGKNRTKMDIGELVQIFCFERPSGKYKIDVG